MLKLLSIACVIPLALSCGSSKQPKDNSSDAIGKPTVYFLHGSPLSLIEETTPELHSPFKISNIEAFKDFDIAKFDIYRSTSPLKDAGDDEKDDHSDDTNESEPMELPRYEFKVHNDRFHYKHTGKKDLPVLEFAVLGETLELVAISYKNSGIIDVKAKHYSVSQAGDLFSILFSYNDDGSEHLGAIYFTRNQIPLTKTKTTNGDYPYLYGRDLAVAWQKPLNFSICGKRASSNAAIIEQSIKSWDQLENGRIGALEYTIETKENAKPFSDVNQNCIFIVDSYKLVASLEKVALGLAIPVVNRTRSELVSGSVLIFENAHRQIGSETSMGPVILHEIGHLLGLGHEFKKDDQGNAVYTSIMSYDGVEAIQQRDFEAIDALYPETRDDQLEAISDEPDPELSSDSTSLIYKLFSTY
jgi:hypothetical protein